MDKLQINSPNGLITIYINYIDPFLQRKNLRTDTNLLLLISKNFTSLLGPTDTIAAHKYSKYILREVIHKTFITVFCSWQIFGGDEFDLTIFCK